jgi:type VI secretion system protein ImpA
MSAEPLLDFEELLKPIPGEAPAGQPCSDTLRMSLDDLRKEPDPLDPSTANRKSDWTSIIRLTKELLATSSKDLIAAVRLMEALTKKEGVLGLRDGLTLVHRLVRECGERLHPLKDPVEGYDVWEGAIKWFNDSARGGQFPATVMRVPLVSAQGNSYSYEDWLRPERKKEFEEAINAIKPDQLRSAYAEWQTILAQLTGLAQALDEKMGVENAPDLLSAETSGNLGNAVNRCLELLDEIGRRKGISFKDPSPEAGNTSPGSATPSDGGSASPAGGTAQIANSRSGLYRQLEEIAESLERIEPHSPIPMLIKRCVRLGSLPFPKLIREIVQDANTLDELDRLLGIPKPE